MILVPILLIVFTTFVPEVLQWPHHMRIGKTEIYSQAPLDQRAAEIIKRADDLVEKSELHDGLVRRRLFLTDGGWRWKLLALNTSGAFAVRRPFRNAIIFNRSIVAADRVENGAITGGERTLSGTIAHETTHILLARRFGELKAALLPTWKVEGYADFVAQESSIDDVEYKRLKDRRITTPAVAYYEARARVERHLRSGHSAEDLFSAH